ncbi:insecticidal delta-endotoxin Cry8Ea1 family protein [Paenibacillus sp. MZ04-78.2]|uniref:insecticidal delta-endotoxin Cry8Ea1 family protein n=1 Tax=Paenibacillus sp. MZ04-78.2 TaxID=2962034 RepID=UPI0020B81ED9|nr:insecticidal delta-endotoxin Cry8Ea1 family protein [Paenibacillus sp. MZ04-78.2]MCP3776586.1 insecticidal delta-endotoxin Cry8Ea1 family protein [Paenibacillus sp. MZ04-78.2]
MDVRKDAPEIKLKANDSSEINPVPYNVLATPLAQVDVAGSFANFTNIFNELKNAYEEFSKTGAKDVLQQHLNIAWGAYKEGKVDYLALTKATISLAGFIPGAGAAVPFINMFVDLVWPHLFGGGSGKNPYTELFNMIMDAVEKLVDNRFREEIIGNLQDSLEGMQKPLVHFQDSIQRAIGQGGGAGYLSILDVKTPDTEQLKTVMRRFENARDIIESNLPHFKDPLHINSPDIEFKRDTVQVTLPLYTTAATLNLLLHQGYIQFMERWKAVFGSDYDSIVDITEIKIDLQKRIQEYTETVYQVFKKYIPDIGTTKGQHNTYNRYVRSMQVNALDIVAMWPTIDPNNYNRSTDLDLSRVIFADAVGPDEMHDGNITIYNILDGAAFFDHSQIALDSISYSRDDLHKIDIIQYNRDGNGCWPYGIQLVYNNQTFEYGDNDPTFPNDNHHYHYTWNAPVSIVNAITQYVSATDLDMENIVINWSRTGCLIPGYPGAKGYAESKNVHIPNQKVDVLYPITVTNVAGAQGKLGLLPSLIPANLESMNRIGVPDEKGNFSIRGIPFEKAYGMWVTVVREYINGANVTKLSKEINSIRVDIFNETNKKYQIRLRYATSGDASFELIIYDQYTQTIVNGNYEFPAPTGNKMYVEGANGKYVLNAIGAASGQLPLDAPFYDLPKGQLLVYIKNTGSADLYLDRIEFVPSAE